MPEPPPLAVPAQLAPGLGALFGGFLAIALTAFGGALPWARRLLVERRRWLTPAEFTDTLALCQFLPGPNIVNVAVAVGTRFRGVAGAAACLLGLTVWPVLLVTTLGILHARYGGAPALRGMFGALGAAAAGLVMAMAWRLAVPLLRGPLLDVTPVMAAAAIAVGLLRLPLVPVLLVLAPLSVAVAWRRAGLAR